MGNLVDDDTWLARSLAKRAGHDGKKENSKTRKKNRESKEKNRGERERSGDGHGDARIPDGVGDGRGRWDDDVGDGHNLPEYKDEKY